ncbi:sigma-70 family RNA polymerase sigma factor [Pseudoalteromonas sp. McH1-42]|uniref:RNA polymerase sigma factor n=1 Tax=Pseudoalteromonas sp. McH1-42 TaxID=2917752 RepID=UPI001EF5E3A6|nr:sigma-70 family RNA polymerase sigma factor [Pseudoalteromonas sp. McH1-42]MCG7564556.1 sigma-70 family RNA polymerase sigma factor [Pseudoalteromonas sp. McH1-42]
MSIIKQQGISHDQASTCKKFTNNVLIKELQEKPGDYWHLWQMYEKRLFSYCFYKLTNRNHHDAEDLCRDTLLKAYEKIDAADPDTPLQGWLFKLARYSFYDQIRKMKTHIKYQSEMVYMEEVEQVEEDELLKQEFNERVSSFIKQSLTRIPKNRSEIAIDFFINEKEYKQISYEKNITESQARKVIFNIRNQIKPALFKFINK